MTRISSWNRNEQAKENKRAKEVIHAGFKGNTAYMKYVSRSKALPHHAIYEYGENPSEAYVVEASA